MTSVQEIGWGSYKQYEGPFYRGTASYSLGKTYTEEQRTMAVITATEGGHFDAINAYDRCILSSGLIQWCEAGQYSVSDMLGAVAEAQGKVPKDLSDLIDGIGVEFKKNSRGRWRFFFKDSRGEVDRIEEQKQLFLLNSSGEKGTWDDASKAHAKAWAAAVANVFHDPVAQKAQVDYTVPRLTGFATKEAKDVLWGTTSSPPAGSGDWRAAGRAAYLSFAANLPTTASKSLLDYVAKAGRPIWSKDWTVGMLKALTFAPNIAIYPARFNAIRPVLEKLYGIDLPDFSDELKKWNDANVINVPNYSPTGMHTVVEVQTALMKLGYDLGPRGADGAFGTKTRDALITFQAVHGLLADGIVGPKTSAALFTLTS